MAKLLNNKIKQLSAELMEHKLSLKGYYEKIFATNAPQNTYHIRSFTFLPHYLAIDAVKTALRSTLKFTAEQA